MSDYNGTANQLFISLDYGANWLDISLDVQWESIRITQRAMNEEFRTAQSTADFTIIYREDLYNAIRATDHTILVQIRNQVAFNTLGSSTLGSITLGGFSSESLVDDAFIAFTGHAKPVYSRKYNGIMDNTMLTLSATDSIDLLEVPCGDVVYRSTTLDPYTIWNSANPAQSIAHQLCLIAGFPYSRLDYLYLFR